MTIEEMKALDFARAAKFYGESPDNQWDTEARFSCLLMPEFLALVEAVERVHGGAVNACMMDGCSICEALDAFNTKLASL